MGYSKRVRVSHQVFYYNPKTYTSEESVLVNLPSNFRATFKVKTTARSGGGFLNIGTDNNNCIFAGQTGSDGSNGLYTKINGQTTTYMASHKNPTNTEILTTLTYNNGVITYNNGTDTVTVNHTIPTLKLFMISIWSTGTLKDLRIHEL